MSPKTNQSGYKMTIQILRKKFAVEQYHHMIETGILIHREQFHRRGGVSPPSAMSLTTQFSIPVMHQQMDWTVDRQFPGLGEETSPLRLVGQTMVVPINSLCWARRLRPYGL